MTNIIAIAPCFALAPRNKSNKPLTLSWHTERLALYEAAHDQQVDEMFAAGSDFAKLVKGSEWQNQCKVYTVPTCCSMQKDLVTWLKERLLFALREREK